MTLTRYLKAKHLTAADLAHAARLHPSLISRYVRGARTPTLVAALRIEAATGGAVPVSSWVSRRAAAPRGTP